ncbi:MAG: hypothetical protein J3R72DRAFT_420867 [Linnemannia gamsii]|nr:MAG: hypothetical protein J3R72DRAFT_420867 [Linnemannia gamsii]
MDLHRLFSFTWFLHSWKERFRFHSFFLFTSSSSSTTRAPTNTYLEEGLQERYCHSYPVYARAGGRFWHSFETRWERKGCAIKAESKSKADRGRRSPQGGRSCAAIRKKHAGEDKSKE